MKKIEVYIDLMYAVWACDIQIFIWSFYSTYLFELRCLNTEDAIMCKKKCLSSDNCIIDLYLGSQPNIDFSTFSMIKQIFAQNFPFIPLLRVMNLEKVHIKCFFFKKIYLDTCADIKLKMFDLVQCINEMIYGQYS